jgi:polyisoprenoid-binding protein YceI
MTTQKNVFKKLIICIALIAFIFNLTHAQMLKLENNNSTLTVFGSSNLHGWKIDANTQNGSIRFNSFETCEIEHLSLAVLTESLESVKPAITASASEALKSDKYKSILFTLVEVKNVDAKGNGVFALQTLGDLVIAGTKKRVPLNFTVTIFDNSVKLVGNTKLKMTDFNIIPPSGMLGTVQAKDDIILRFETRFIETIFI